MNLKKKTCKKCGKDNFIFSKGRCKKCALISYQAKRDDYSDFFNSIIPLLPKVDFETKKWINTLSNANCCHIFPKSIYKSVSRNINNIIVLSIENHTKLDNYLFKMEFEALKNEMPNTYAEIIKRSKQLMHEIKENGVLKRKILELWKNK